MNRCFAHILSGVLALVLAFALATAPALAVETERVAVEDADFLAAVEKCINLYMKSSNEEAKQARLTVVEELLEAGRIDTDFFFDLFDRCRNANDFAGDYNGMLKSADIYDHTVGSGVDGSFDRFAISRWLEATGGERYYAYSAGPRAVPDIGVPYVKTGDTVLTAEEHRRVSRLLEAGYPVDLYGLAGQHAVGYSNLYKSMITQELLLMLLGKVETSPGDPYMEALYDYAVGDETLTPIGKADASFDERAELVYQEKSGLYSAEIPLRLNGTVEQATVTAIPEGAKVLVSGKAVRVGSAFDPAEPITVTTDNEAPITGEFAISYVSYEIVDDAMGQFATYNLVYTASGEEAVPYTELVGYQMKSVYGDAALNSFALVGGPEEPEEPEVPEKPAATIDFAYAAPVKEGESVAASPEGVSVPARQRQENTSIRYIEPDPLHGSGEVPEGYTFHGWYADEACTNKVVSHTILPSGTTLYGYWTKAADPEPPVEPEKPSEPENPGGGGGNTDRPTPPVRPEEPSGPEVDLPEEEPPMTDKPEIDIPGEEPPLGDLPETDEPETGLPEDGGDAVIPETQPPLGNLPQTGTADPSATIGVLALAASLALAGLAVATRKRADGEQ